MTLDELIAALNDVRAKDGNLRVVVENGRDPSDLEPVRRLAIGDFGFITGGYPTERAVYLSTG